jgi:hypothetical protein
VKKIRHRSLFLFGGTAIAAAASFYTDPDANYLSTILGGLAIIQGIWAVAAAHWARKALMDYDESDQRRLFTKASEGATGAGLALVALAIVFVGLLTVFAPRAHAALPAGYIKYGQVLKDEQRKYWPDHPRPALLASLVEQESCVTLKHSKCWQPTASLKSTREEGAGLGQITRAYRKDGSLRFDTISSLREKYNSELGSLTWDNVYSRPDLQLRAIVLMSKDSARPFMGNGGWLAFGDAAYNGGVAGVQKERRACKMTQGCDPRQWFNNVETHCLKSRQPLYGGRSACDINREHVRNVMLVRVKKYEIV